MICYGALFLMGLAIGLSFNRIRHWGNYIPRTAPCEGAPPKPRGK